VLFWAFVVIAETSRAATSRRSLLTAEGAEPDDDTELVESFSVNATKTGDSQTTFTSSNQQTEPTTPSHTGIPPYIPQIAPPSKGGVFEAAERIDSLPRDISTCTRDGSPEIQAIFVSRVWFSASKEGFNNGDKVIYFETNCRFEKAGSWDGGTWWTFGGSLHLVWDIATPPHGYPPEALTLKGTKGKATLAGPTLTLTRPTRIPEPENYSKTPLKFLMYYWAKPDANPLWLCFRNAPHSFINSCDSKTPLMTFSDVREDLNKSDLIGVDAAAHIMHINSFKPIKKKKRQHIIGMSRELGHVKIGPARTKELLSNYDLMMDWRMDGDIPMSFHHYHFFGTHNADDYYREPLNYTDRYDEAVVQLSHCETDSDREGVIRKLWKWFPVRTAGRCRGPNFDKTGDQRYNGPSEMPEEFRLETAPLVKVDVDAPVEVAGGKRHLFAESRISKRRRISAEGRNTSDPPKTTPKSILARWNLRDRKVAAAAGASGTRVRIKSSLKRSITPKGPEGLSRIEIGLRRRQAVAAGTRVARPRIERHGGWNATTGSVSTYEKYMFAITFDSSLHKVCVIKP
jgi:hypothetical protein